MSRLPVDASLARVHRRGRRDYAGLSGRGELVMEGVNAAVGIY